MPTKMDNDKDKDRYSGWTSILHAVDSKPLALLALIVLATEAMLGLSLGGGKPEDRFATILTMVALLVLVIVAMIIMVLKKPDLFGKESGSGLREPSEPAQAEKDQLVQKHKRLVVDAERPPLSPDDQAKHLQLLRSVIHQAQRYSTPTYYLDVHLAVIHWNVAFELIFRPILPRIARRHVNYFIAELSNSADVFDHARAFTAEVRQGKLPLVDCELLTYESPDYGLIEFGKVAAQLTDADANLKAWSVALLLKKIDWDLYVSHLEQRLRDDKLWSIYAVSYDAILSDFPPYKNLIDEVLAGIPSAADHVLELGAGTGNVTNCLLQRGLRVTAIENNPSMLEEMHEKRLQLQGRLTLVAESVEDTTFGEETRFDAAVAVNVAYALEDPAGCFRRVAEVLRPGGVFALSTTYSETELDPLLNSIRKDLISKGRFQEQEEHYQRVVAVNKDIEFKIARRYSREQYQTWLEEAGFDVEYNQLSYVKAVVVMHARKR